MAYNCYISASYKLQKNTGLDPKYVGMHAITENGEKTQSKYLI